MKTNYQSPQTEVVYLQTEHPLLAGSGRISEDGSSATVPGGNAQGGNAYDEAASNSSFWDSDN